MLGGLSRTARIASIATAVLVVFVVWLLVASTNAGIAFFFSVPIGLAAWWYGRRAALAVALVCLCLYVVGDLINPVPPRD